MKSISRRNILAGLGAVGVLPATGAIAQEIIGSELVARHNVSSFRSHRWQDHFNNLRNGAILSDTKSRMLQYGPRMSAF